MTSPSLSRIALASLAVLALASALLAVVPVHGQRGGAILAGVKVLVLAFVFVRAWRRDVYALQWSSMLILVFFAEAIVRATSDPPPASLIGIVATGASAAYFAAVLAWLRPLKKAARKERA